MPAPRQWKRSDFADAQAFRAWKAKGSPKAKPFERAGFATDYQYRKARKSYAGYVKNTKAHPVPEPTKIRKAVQSQQKSAKAGRIDRSLVKSRRPSGKSPNFAVAVRVTFTDGTTRDFSRKFPTLPTVKKVEREVIRLFTNADYFRAIYGSKSDPAHSGSSIESVVIQNVTAPAVKKAA
jgi:hypothetical protein